MEYEEKDINISFNQALFLADGRISSAANDSLRKLKSGQQLQNHIFPLIGYSEYTDEQNKIIAQLFNGAAKRHARIYLNHDITGDAARIENGKAVFNLTADKDPAGYPAIGLISLEQTSEAGKIIGNDGMVIPGISTKKHLEADIAMKGQPVPFHLFFDAVSYVFTQLQWKGHGQKMTGTAFIPEKFHRIFDLDTFKLFVEKISEFYEIPQKATKAFTVNTKGRCIELVLEKESFDQLKKAEPELFARAKTSPAR